MFSACGGIRTGKAPCQFLTAYFPVLAQGILGKGRLFVAPPLDCCLTGITGSSTQLYLRIPGLFVVVGGSVVVGSADALFCKQIRNVNKQRIEKHLKYTKIEDLIMLVSIDCFDY